MNMCYKVKPYYMTMIFFLFLLFLLEVAQKHVLVISFAFEIVLSV